MSGSTTVSDGKETVVSAPLVEDQNYRQWQTKLLPFMTRMVSALTLFFFLASFGQLIYLHVNIRNTPALNLNESFSQLAISSGLTPQQTIEASKLKSLIMLEGHSLERQYHQANVLLMARVWTSYLGFVTGMVLALVGAAFILGKLREPVSEISTAIQATSISLKSASPGLLLAGLGTTLMLATIITHHNIEVVDKAVYLHDSPATIPIAVSEQPPLELGKPSPEKKTAVITDQPLLQRPTPKTENSASLPEEQHPLQRPVPTNQKAPAAALQAPSLQRPAPRTQVTPKH
jgi:hypothetical protein